SPAYVQRQGNLIQEQIAGWAKQSVGMQVANCGGNTTDGRSVAIEDANGPTRCIFQNPEAADTDAGLFVCNVGNWTSPCSGGSSYNLLNLTPSAAARARAWPLRD